MLEQITPEIQGIVTTIVIGIFGIVSTIIVKAIKKAENKVNAWLDAKATNEQRELINKYAKDAFAFAETLYIDLKGEQKLETAKGYLQTQLKSIGIEITNDELKAVIEKAVLEYNKDKSQ